MTLENARIDPMNRAGQPERTVKEVEELRESREAYDEDVRNRTGGRLSDEAARSVVKHRDAIVDEHLLSPGVLQERRLPAGELRIHEMDIAESNLRIRHEDSSNHDILSGTIGKENVVLRHATASNGYSGEREGKQISGRQAALLWKRFFPIAKERGLRNAGEIEQEREEQHETLRKYE